jgi:hypothetical protein
VAAEARESVDLKGATIPEFDGSVVLGKVCAVANEEEDRSKLLFPRPQLQERSMRLILQETWRPGTRLFSGLVVAPKGETLVHGMSLHCHWSSRVQAVARELGPTKVLLSSLTVGSGVCDA